jgi:cytochrome b
MTSSQHRDAVVWDLPTRIFHWSLVILVGANLFLISPRGGLHTVVHFVAGYVVAGLLLFRLFWGFIGSQRSRFADFLHRWPVVKGYIERLRRFDPPHSVGHNPLGGWMIVVLLSTLLAMVATGLLAAGRRAAGPLADLVPLPAAALAGQLHSLISNLLIGLIVVHLAGVAVDWFLTGDNLVKAMLTGRKQLSIASAAREGKVAPPWRAVLVGLLSLALVAGLTLSTDYTRTRNTLSQAAGQQ